MTRGNFLKSLFTFVVAGPSIAKSINFKAKKPSEAKIKKAIAFKLTLEELDDLEYVKSYTQRSIKEAGIDESKPYDYRIGYENDDFVKNRLTCVISQYQ